jgi:hypothetical protein
MTACEISGGWVAVGAIYFFFAGIVAEHSSSNLHKDISSPIPSILRGLLWPLVALKYLALMIVWGLR